MASDRYPGYWNMVALSGNAATVQRNHKWNMAHYHATDADCIISDVRERPRWDGKHGIEVQYKVTWFTYLGWKVANLHTGCFASIPAEEERLDHAQRVLAAQLELQPV